MPDWNWGESQGESGVVHQSTANTDHNDAGTLKQGYDYQNFSEITPNPAVCWPLHEDSGTTAYDAAGSRNGTYYGPSLGQNGLLKTTAPSFDGVDDYADMTDVSAINGVSELTMSFWHKGEVSGNSTYIYRKNDGSNLIQGFFNDSISAFRTRWDIGGNKVILDIPYSEFTADVYHLLTCSYDGSSMRVYVDAVEKNSTSATGTLDVAGSKLYVGAANSSSEQWQGQLSDWRIYNTALSATQIQTLYDVVNTAGTWTGSPKPL